jgi:hypothetical protein
MKLFKRTNQVKLIVLAMSMILFSSVLVLAVPCTQTYEMCVGLEICNDIGGAASGFSTCGSNPTNDVCCDVSNAIPTCPGGYNVCVADEPACTDLEGTQVTNDYTCIIDNPTNPICCDTSNAPSTPVDDGITTYSMTSPKSTKGSHSILAWGESGTYTFNFAGLGENQVTECVVNKDPEECKWRLKVLVNGVNKYGGMISVPAGLVLGPYIDPEVTQGTESGSVDVTFTVSPPTNMFASIPVPIKWHGIDYQTWTITPIVSYSNGVDQMAGTVSIAVVENMEEFGEMLNNDTMNIIGDPLHVLEVEHLRYKLNNVVTVTDSTYNYDCSSLGEFKPDWAAFKAANGGLGIAKTDVEGLKTLMDTQVAASYSVQDAIELGDAIKKASESFSAARDTIRDTFSGCPCNDACPAS